MSYIIKKISPIDLFNHTSFLTDDERENIKEIFYMKPDNKGNFEKEELGETPLDANANFKSYMNGNLYIKIELPDPAPRKGGVKSRKNRKSRKTKKPMRKNKKTPKKK